MVATPRVAKATDALSEFAPAMYAVVIVQVIVMLPEVLLKMLIALPSENVASGMVIDPPEPTCTYLPTSPVASVYEPVLVPTGGMLLKPTAFVPSTVQEDNTPCEGVPSKGVTSVGDVANTAEPLPVSSVKAAAKLALDGVAKNVATLVPRPDTPVEIGKPLQLVRVPPEGVPNAPPGAT